MEPVSPSHTLAYVQDVEHGIRVPVTRIALEASPNGQENLPFTVYRTGLDPGEWTRVKRRVGSLRPVTSIASRSPLV